MAFLFFIIFFVRWIHFTFRLQCKKSSTFQLDFKVTSFKSLHPWHVEKMFWKLSLIFPLWSINLVRKGVKSEKWKTFFKKVSETNNIDRTKRIFNISSHFRPSHFQLKNQTIFFRHCVQNNTLFRHFFFSVDCKNFPPLFGPKSVSPS